MRYKHSLFTFFFTAWSAVSIAQQNQSPDSLLNVMKTQRADTNKAKTLGELSKWYSMRGNAEMSNKYGEEAIALSNKLSFKKGLILPYTCIGLNHSYAGEYEEALKNHKLVLKIAAEIGNKNGMGAAYNNIGLIYGDEGKNTEAINSYLKAATLFEQEGNKKSAANSYYNTGNTYYSPLSNFTEAIKYQLISLKLSTEINDKRQMTNRYIDLGNNYESLGNYPEAIKNYFAGLKLAEETGAKGNVASAYNNIGLIYFNQGNHAEAMKYYQASMKVAEEMKSKYLISANHDNIGEVYRSQGNYEKALENHRLALKMGEEMKYTYGMGYSYANIGSTYFLKGSYNDALVNYSSSLKLFEKINENEGKAKIYIALGETHLKQKNYSEAKEYFNRALLTSKEFGGKKIMRDAYENLARVDSANSQWQSAFQNHNSYLLYRDSLINEENKNKVTEIRMQYEFGKKEDSLHFQQFLTGEQLKRQTLLSRQQQQSLLLKGQELALKEQELELSNSEKNIQQLQIEKNAAAYAIQKVETEKKQSQLEVLNNQKNLQTLELDKQKQLKAYLIAGLALVIVLSFFVYRHYHTRQELKLQLLRNKIASDLHDDVGSTLSSISIFSQMAQQQSKEVMPLLDTIGESSRRMLDAMADIVWTIKPENDQFEKIILRMKNFAYDLLGAKNIDFEFIADNDVSKMNLPMDVRKNLYLIFKEATNNLVKYSNADKAMFLIKEEKNNLLMMIRDNGKGFDTNSSANGNGLTNMKKRAQEIGAQFNIDSTPGNGTTIQLKVAV